MTKPHIFLTSEHLEGAGFARAVDPQQPKGLSPRYPQTDVVHSNERFAPLAGGVEFGQVLYSHSVVRQVRVQHLFSAGWFGVLVVWLDQFGRGETSEGDQ